MREAKLASDQIEHGDEIDAGAKASSLAFNCAEDTVESLHESVGQSRMAVSLGVEKPRGFHEALVSRR
jgi:hypothetical protein